VSGEITIWLSAGSHIVTIQHENFAPYTMRIEAYKEVNYFINITMIELSIYSFNALEVQAIVDVKSQTKFDIPAGALVDKDGKVYEGMAELKVGFLDASNLLLWGSMPGEYAGYLADGTYGIFDSFNALFFEFFDSNKLPLYIK
jgi:hypothetical protein